MPNPLGVNTTGYNQDLVMGKPVSKTGPGITGKEKALEQAKAMPGSELVYREPEGDWRVAPLDEKGVVMGKSPLHSADKANITFDQNELEAKGIEHPVISFVDEKASLDTLISLADDVKTSPQVLASLPQQASEKLDEAAHAHNRIFLRDPNPTRQAVTHSMISHRSAELKQVSELTDKLIDNWSTPTEALNDLVKLHHKGQQMAKTELYTANGKPNGESGLPLTSSQLQKLAKHHNLDSKQLISVLGPKAGAQAAGKLKGEDPQSLLQDSSPELKYAAARNTALPEELIPELALDLDPKMRLAIAENFATPRNVLFELARDPDPKVKAAAQKMLSY